MLSDSNPFASPLAEDSPVTISPTGEHQWPLPEGFVSASGRARAATWAFRIFMVLIALSAGSSLLEYQLLEQMKTGAAITDEQIETNDLRQSSIAILVLLALLTNVVLYGRWVYRAHKNLPMLAKGLFQTTPGWAIGYYFLPILNLFRPYQATKELWRGSEGKDADKNSSAPGVIKIWWAMWLLQNITGNISLRMMGSGGSLESYQLGDMADVVDCGVTFIAAWFALRVIRGIDRRQTERATELGYLKPEGNEWADWSESAAQSEQS